MADEKNVGSIVYEISADVKPLLQGGKQAIDALDKLDTAAQQSGRGMSNLDQSASQTGTTFTELAGYANSMDNQLRKLNTSVSGIARAMMEARTGVSSTTSELNRANAVIEALGNQVAILEEAQENGARSAAVFASQLRAGANATEEEKRTIAELAGVFYDLSASSAKAAKSAASMAAATQRTESSISGLEKEVSILNTEMQTGSRSAAILAAQFSAGEGASDAQKAKIAQLAGALFDMREAQKSASAASAEAAKQLAQQANEANRISGITSDLSNQIAILSEQQTNGARSAAILAAQLRAGASATDADKQKIAQLTGQLYDMKNSVDTGTKSHVNWKTSVQQAGYQVQDFIVQVQGGQSALVALSQQGSQLAGIFGPGGAVVGAIIALGSVLAGVLITSLNGGKNAMTALKEAAEAMDKVISVSSQGVAALSDKYAALARVNADVATLLRNQALLEYNQAISKIPKAISEASDAFITFGDRAIAAVGGASPSIKKFNAELSALGVTSKEWGEAIQQANSQGQYASGIVNSLSSTVNTLSSRLGISKQAAFDLARELSNLSNNPSPEALQELAKKLQDMKSSSTDGQSAIAGLAGKLVDLAREAANAKINVDSLNQSTDNLTAGQKNLIKQSERNLALSKLQGEARARLQAQYAAEDAGFSKDDPHAKQMENDAAATYKNTQAQKDFQSTHKKSTSQAESVAQKLANLKQQSELVADSTKELSREQAILTAQQSLGKGATKEQIALAGQYAAKKWDTANAIKAEAAARKLLPEAAENASYKQDVEDLNTALAAKKISQEQYNQTSERLAATHQANIAKIQSQQVVTPQQELAAQVDPVQQLANENAKKLALIQAYELSGVLAHDQAVALKNAADTQYEEQRLAALEQQYRAQSVLNDFTMDMIDAVGQRTTNAITGIITGTQSATDALRNMASTILDQAVGALVQMGVQALKNMLIGQSASAASVAQAAITGPAIAAAYSPAAAMVSLASFGANAAAAQAGIASTMGLTKMLSVAGARYNGGPVSANSMYRVGENGKPEIFQASNGSQYMIPGDNGRVVSNRDMQGGNSSSPVNIVINNTAAGTVVENQGFNPDTKTITLAVNEVARQLRSHTGVVARALSDSWNTTGKAQ
ncbi:tail protein (tape measure) [Escherichia marmotae]|uniref:tail protein (tape measure) n=1 Tax=Escherichia marmotae TaxID=1499973 RepID=UPI001F4DA78D|nr:tail protein (tape measure) [Escherichia marmotae]MEC9626127.1 tail protein (tape measure) [Escherichia marmotae]MED0363725.1 tail protein (tape measure) [Escherichia marmotae]MED8777096.1 tail protein (tape measure) [Escherichia marmotae]MED9200608.1 tail protein (tape measure) [Escherichia marmotae]UNH33026.1 tail protein (tape measure) [Escherichia marmotae]